MPAKETIGMDRTGSRRRTFALLLTLAVAGAFPSAAAAADTDSDLSVSLVGSPDPVPDHTLLTYSVTATNPGPADTYANVYDNLPNLFTFMTYGGDAAVNCVPTQPGLVSAVVCAPYLAAGQSKTLTVTVQTYQCVTGVTDEAGVSINSDGRSDPNPANNQ